MVLEITSLPSYRQRRSSNHSYLPGRVSMLEVQAACDVSMRHIEEKVPQVDTKLCRVVAVCCHRALARLYIRSS
eukprot:77482-Amorphochlora_amoeboformis.AAC.1